MQTTTQKEIDQARCCRLYVAYMGAECMSLGWDAAKSREANDAYMQACKEYEIKYGESWERKVA